MKYDVLTKELSERITDDRKNGTMPDFGAKDSDAERRFDYEKDRATVWRNAYTRDVDKIMHSAYYNRYADKTQVFSLYKNDDITRRSLHVQLVSRIARTIGGILNLNIDLIEAIALGHDIGHTPFGHVGEKFLNELYSGETGRYFSHNVHSVRVLDRLFPYNISLHTLNGILSHNGEFPLGSYSPKDMSSFAELDFEIEKCYKDIKYNRALIPSTLEGCLVRVCDMIAYLGKDRQDAIKAKVIDSYDCFANESIGMINSEIINNLVVNLVENSYGKKQIKLDGEYFDALLQAKKSNDEKIYMNENTLRKFNKCVKPMMEMLYFKLLSDVRAGNKASIIYRHHIKFVNKTHYQRITPYEETESNQIVVDFIASMTDDYFIDLFGFLFPNSSYSIRYIGYFDSKNK